MWIWDVIRVRVCGIDSTDESEGKNTGSVDAGALYKGVSGRERVRMWVRNRACGYGCGYSLGEEGKARSFPSTPGSL